MAILREERSRRIEQYSSGPDRFRRAVGAIPEEARKWRPAAGEFSVHEVVVHCADSETNAAARIRYLIAETRPLVLGYDPDNWALTFDYHSHPLEAALATIDAVRANTAPILRALPDSAWAKAGTHTESGRYSTEEWLMIYSEHLEEHVIQIERAYAAWKARR